jgi:protein-S-isoprenylcysteine O-methyltransferase Ste14
MSLIDEMGMQGAWLFRWRSYIPVALLALMLPPSLLGLHWPFGSHRFHNVWELVCLAVSLLGLAIRCATVGFVPAGTSGRGTTKLSAKALNTTGLYSLVRHPVYVGNYLVGLGVTLVWFDWWAPVTYSLSFWLYYERIMIAEEQFLLNQYGNEFLQWAKYTPSFIPTPSQFTRWKRPALPFSFVSTVRREYSTLVLVVALHAGMEAIENYWMGGRLSFGREWGPVLGCTLALYAFLAFLKKRTWALKVSGR